MKSILLVFGFVFLIGCKSKGYDPNLMRRLTASEQRIVGKYKMAGDYSAAESKEVKQVLKMLEALGGDVILECRPDKKFILSVGDVPVTGDWTLEDLTLRLAIRQVNDRPPSEIARFDLRERIGSIYGMSDREREEFITSYQNSVALQRAESLASLRVGADGNLYTAEGTAAEVLDLVPTYLERMKTE